MEEPLEKDKIINYQKLRTSKIIMNPKIIPDGMKKLIAHLKSYGSINSEEVAKVMLNIN